MKNDLRKRYLEAEKEKVCQLLQDFWKTSTLEKGSILMMALWTCNDGTKHFVGICAVGTGPDYNKIDISDSNGWIHTVDMNEIEIWG